MEWIGQLYMHDGNTATFKHYCFAYDLKDLAEKGLELYSNGVLIMEKCSDLLPDYFSFVKGVVDTEDISLYGLEEITDEALKDLKLRFKGSSNQRILDVQKSLAENNPVLMNLT